jgi:hypothetical protein
MLGEPCRTPLFSVMHPPAHASNSVPDEGIPRPSHPLALFSLVPVRGNERATRSVAYPDNIRYISILSDSVEALDVGFHIHCKSSTTLVILGRGIEADIYVEGSSIVKV